MIKFTYCFRTENAEKKSLDEITCVENLSDGEAEDEGNLDVVKYNQGTFTHTLPIIEN